MSNRLSPEAEAIRRQALSRSKPSRNGKHKPASKPKPSRFTTYNHAVDCHLPKMSGSEAKAYMVLWRCERGGVVELSHQQLADACGVTRRAAINAVAKLTAMKLIRRIKKGNVRRESNRYQLIPPS